MRESNAAIEPLPLWGIERIEQLKSEREQLQKALGALVCALEVKKTGKVGFEPSFSNDYLVELLENARETLDRT